MAKDLTDTEKHARYVEAARRNLEKKALEYARMKLFGLYYDGQGNACRVCFSDQESQAKTLLSVLGQAAEQLVQELAAAPLPERITA